VEKTAAAQKTIAGGIFHKPPGNPKESKERCVSRRGREGEEDADVEGAGLSPPDATLNPEPQFSQKRALSRQIEPHWGHLTGMSGPFLLRILNGGVWDLAGDYTRYRGFCICAG
jgi:hypothetical protein